MRRPKTKDDNELVVFALRLEPVTIEEIKRRAAADRRPAGQWLRNLINDALTARKVVVK